MRLRFSLLLTCLRAYWDVVFFFFGFPSSFFKNTALVRSMIWWKSRVLRMSMSLVNSFLVEVMFVSLKLPLESECSVFSFDHCLYIEYKLGGWSLASCWLSLRGDFEKSNL